MSLTSGFCSKCGSPSENGKLCGNCRAKDIVWIRIEPRVQCTFCPTCGSTKAAGIWTDCPVERQELACNLVNSAISIHRDVTNIQRDTNITDLSVNRSIATVFVSGTLYGVPVEITQKVQIVWACEQCNRCCRISGSYYEGVIQVRAAGRKPTPFELRRAAEIAYQIEDQLQNAGDRLSFVSDITEQKDGIDIIFSSQTIGSAISRDICGALGGSFTTHPKLVGEKAGIKLYRVTYSLRLPRFSRGDIIKHGRGYFRIFRQTKDMLFVQDLATCLSRNFREDDSVSSIGNIQIAETATVVYRDAGTLGVLDPATQNVAEIPDYTWIEADAGDTILFVRDCDTLIPVGKADENPQSFEEQAAKIQD
ncbi:MAG: 60S ribosomal export protein NMD3 [Methanocalculaceae archaeon]|jgi:nonsense-mediated mRNA decay protein 3|nr:60S ribosomal export protein NMD3 [Methanocalculaceae archaeon]